MLSLLFQCWPLPVCQFLPRSSVFTVMASQRGPSPSFERSVPATPATFLSHMKFGICCFKAAVLGISPDRSNPDGVWGPAWGWACLSLFRTSVKFSGFLLWCQICLFIHLFLGFIAIMNGTLFLIKRYVRFHKCYCFWRLILKLATFHCNGFPVNCFNFLGK